MGVNLPMDKTGLTHVRTEVAARLKDRRIRQISSPETENVVISPIGTVPKPHSTKLRTIHHLSYPRKKGCSINDGIDQNFVSIRYDNLDTLLEFVRDNQGAYLWKADLREAFRHIAVAKSQARLLGFQIDDKVFVDCALPFGSKSSPWLFNLFAEGLHWLLDSVITQPGYSRTTHYLDDFFGAVASSEDPTWPIFALRLATTATGFSLSPKKTAWASKNMEILGVEVDTVHQTASITDSRRDKVIALCQTLLHKGQASLHDLQKVAGHLQFITRVVPHGRAFLRRIYDAVKARYCCNVFATRLSKTAKDKLEWWIATLTSWPGR